MTIKLICDKSNPPLGALFVASLINSPNNDKVKIEWSQKNSIGHSSGETVCGTSLGLLRQIAQSFATGLCGVSPTEKTQIDHWLCYTMGPLAVRKDFSTALSSINKILGPSTYFVGNKISIADLAVFASLFANKQWQSLVSKKQAPSSVLRWYKFIESQDFVKKVIDKLDPSILEAAIKSSEQSNDDIEQLTAGGRAREGKFVELPGAEMGKVVVRFPPEASGYLHIGHAKAALLNQYYQQAFDGKLVMRFDDTNPAKEDTHFEEVILEDVAMLEIKPDMFTYTSDYFDLMLSYCEKMLKDGTAYVDDTDPETMKQEREQKVESANRSNSVEKNFKMWEEMKKGTEYGQKCCVRAKIDMKSLNGCLRDPTIYRCKNEAHPRTGTKYRVYPTYDFACPIVDSIEGVTHTLRTMEYHDRDPQFYWFIDCLGLRKPYIWEYSRLSMTNTVLSKRKLTWFVEQGLVDGWDDPRMPTVRGVLRRGMTVEGLKEFIIAQGSSRSVVFMEWDKIWAFNKKVIDPIAERYTVVDFNNHVPVTVKGAKEERLSVPKHPKNPDLGMKSVWVGPKILIDKADAESLKVGENATFINWGNLMIKKINRIDGNVVSVEAEPNLDNKDYKKTLKLTFLCETSKAKFTHTFCVYFDHIISKPLLGKDEDFKQFVGHETRKDLQVLGDPELKNLKKGDIIQVQRRGFFRVDVPYGERSPFTCKEQPIILFYIPDGSSKDNPFAALAGKQEKTAPKESKTNVKAASGGSTPSAQSTSAEKLNEDIIKQGDIVRDLKAKKAPKPEIDTSVKVLLSLKAKYKEATGSDWKPGCTPPKAVVEVKSVENKGNSKSAESINEEIIKQGNLVRDLKGKKAPKPEVDDAVKLLLSLKAEYKTATGSEWKPGCAPPKAAGEIKSTENTGNKKSAESINEEIIKQGNLVRDLKGKKAPKPEVDDAVKLLLSLKAEYKTATGSEWKPGCTPPKAAVESKGNVKSAESINDEIIKQGNIVRDLKGKKAPKPEVDDAVKLLLSLKAEYKSATGSEWKPGCTPPQAVVEAKSAETKSSAKSAESINDEIIKQGNIVRDLKGKKAPKPEVDDAVKLLLSLKAEYKAATGLEWKPGCTPPQAVVEVKSAETKGGAKSAESINEEIIKQGNIVRDLKGKKAPKPEVDDAVKLLLSLKAEYKTATGSEWKPGCTPPKAAVEVESAVSKSAEKVNEEIIKQGNNVRDLKGKKAPKPEIDDAVKLLLSLKADYKSATGSEWKPGCTPPKTSKSTEMKASPKPAEIKAHPKSTAIKSSSKSAEAVNQEEDKKVKKQTRLCLEAKKEENLPDWYSQVLTKGEMIDYYDVSGCYIYRPWSYELWEILTDFLKKEIKKMNVKNCYFPIFVSKAMLEKEKKHIADFSPEVAWVTKAGDSEMSEPVAVRPTSETVMYPIYAKWIQSYRDLPLKLNQWNNVVRWEFKHPQPFLRTREFLWQEGHTAFATFEEAKEEVSVVLDLYERVYTELLAVPVIKGRKTEKEKFAGGDYTYTVEAYIPASGRAIQGATSHHLGQNFSKMFDITFEDPQTKEKRYVYQNSWGLTTRTIGVMIMIHSDNQGLVLPPRVASIQVVIVPCGITATLSEENRAKLDSSCIKLANELESAGLRVEGDYRDYYSPGWKFNHWELMGVPVRIELGPKDLEKEQLVAVRRDTGEKITIPLKNAANDVSKLLDTIQSNLYSRALEQMKNHVVIFKNWSDFVPNLENKNLNLVPFCGDEECEDKIKVDSTRDVGATDSAAPSSGAKSLCIPLEQPAKIEDSDKCIHPSCSKKPQFYTLFGRSY